MRRALFISLRTRQLRYRVPGGGGPGREIEFSLASGARGARPRRRGCARGKETGRRDERPGCVDASGSDFRRRDIGGRSLSFFPLCLPTSPSLRFGVFRKKNIRALRAPFIAPNFPLSRRRDIAHKSVPRPVPARVRNPPTRKSAALFLRVPPPPLPSPLFNISRQHFILFRRIDVNFFLSPRASGRCRRFRGRELAR